MDDLSMKDDTKAQFSDGTKGIHECFDIFHECEFDGQTIDKFSPLFPDCCSDLKEKSIQLVGRCVIVGKGCESVKAVTLSIQKTKTLLRIPNEQTETSAFKLIHLLSHLRGWTFKGVSWQLNNFNPAIYECFHESPLDIRYKEPNMCAKGIPDEKEQLIMKTMVRPAEIWMDVLEFDPKTGHAIDQVLSFAAEAKQWCSTLTVRNIKYAIDECIQFMIDAKKELNMPKMIVRPYFISFSWPSLCPMPDGVPDDKDCLPPMSYHFSNEHSKQEFSATLVMKRAWDGVTRVTRFELQMT